MEKSILYFDSVGEANTDAVIEAAAKRAVELKISHIVVASTSGKTALKMAEAVKGSSIKVVGITQPVRAERKRRVGSRRRVQKKA